MMDTVLFDNGVVIITPWKLVGYLGLTLFSSRWIVQLFASKKAKAVTFPIAFWLMSLSGSFCLLLYFIWGKNDSVGILGNLFPACVASYNLYLELKNRRNAAEESVQNGA